MPPRAVRHYLRRSRHLLVRLSRRPDRDALLSRRLHRDMFDTGLHVAVAIRFAARGLCPPTRRPVPEIDETRDCAALLACADAVSASVASIHAGDLLQRLRIRPMGCV